MVQIHYGCLGSSLTRAWSEPPHQLCVVPRFHHFVYNWFESHALTCSGQVTQITKPTPRRSEQGRAPTTDPLAICSVQVVTICSRARMLSGRKRHQRGRTLQYPRVHFRPRLRRLGFSEEGNVTR